MADVHSPDEIVRLYDAGMVGSYCDPEDTALLVRSLPMPFFGHTLAETGAGKVSLPFSAVVAFDALTGRKPYDEAQTTGDCVSHAVRNAIDVARANDPDLKSTEDWVDRTATEPIYGARGHSGQGAVCSQLVRWAHQQGGCMLRKKYPDLKLDLSTYNAPIGMRWGAPGVPGPVTAEAAKHRVGTISLVQDWRQARDAIANGYGIVCCSDVGFRHSRDSEGLSTPQGTWHHAMAWTGVDDTRSGDCRFLIQNSWGWNWVQGPKVYSQPEGSFWVTQSAAQRMIAQGGTWAVSNVSGFPRRKLDDWGAKAVLG
jgi:hypothetical protein